MPIKRRSIIPTKLPYVIPVQPPKKAKKPLPVPVVASPKINPIPRSHALVIPRQGHGIRRRKTLPDVEVILTETNTSPFLFEDCGILVVKTPSECTRWPHDFRKRIVADYTWDKWIPNSQLESFMRQLPQDHVYAFAGRKVRVTNHMKIVPPGTLFTKTEVQRLDTGMSMILRYSEPAMRVLLVYAFLRDEEIPGLPKMRIVPTGTI